MSAVKQGGKHQFLNLTRMCHWDRDCHICVKMFGGYMSCEKWLWYVFWWQWGERVDHNLWSYLFVPQEWKGLRLLHVSLLGGVVAKPIWHWHRKWKWEVSLSVNALWCKAKCDCRTDATLSPSAATYFNVMLPFFFTKISRSTWVFYKHWLKNHLSISLPLPTGEAACLWILCEASYLDERVRCIVWKHGCDVWDKSLSALMLTMITDKCRCIRNQ